METEYLEEELRVPKDTVAVCLVNKATKLCFWIVAAMAIWYVLEATGEVNKKQGIAAGEWNVRKEAVELGYGRIEKGFFVWNQKN